MKPLACSEEGAVRECRRHTIGLWRCALGLGRMLLVMALAGGASGGAPALSGGAAPEPSTRRGLMHLSADPADQELSRARVFDEPLLPLGKQSDAPENRALGSALEGYANRIQADDFSSLTGFLQSYPQSRWRASLLLHLGTEYYNSGFYSRALTAWEEAWQAFKPVTSGPAKLQADRALGELARMYCNVGRTHDVAILLDANKDRPLEGPGTQLVEAARQVLWLMKNRPGSWFKCGPLALQRILLNTDPAKANNPLVSECTGTTNGFSLAQVADISRQLGMNYQMAFRSPGSELIVPAVVHWKAGHYAALVQREGERFLAQDPTFRVNPWMSRSAIDEEASGYFLVPAGTLPAGWRPASTDEARQVWGKGPPNGLTPGATSKCDTKSGGCSGACSGSGGNPTGMASYTMHTMLASLSLNDTPVGYTPPFGPPIQFTASYSQREASQPATFYYSNLGPKWTCNWISFINDNPTSPTADVSFYVDGGGSFTFTGFNSSTQTYAVERMSHTLLTRTSSSSYTLLYPDGSQRVFAASDGSVGTSRRVFLTQVIDKSGNVVQLNYDAELRITNIVDALGQSTTLQYTNAAYPFAITTVIDPFGRSAQLQYNASGRLAQITDVIGLSSQFAYITNDFISALTTPYGTTTFATGLTNSITWLQATDPLGANELLEINQNTPIAASDPLALVPHGIGAYDNYLIYRNSLFWDKKACLEGAGDVTKAIINHFCHETSGAESPIIESIKAPLENRVWYTYLGQSSGIYAGPSASPSFVGRVMDDGTTQVYGYQYNALGNLTNVTDPVGRTFSFIYDPNSVDLLEVHMTHNGKNELLNRATYNAQHLPLTLTDASGQTWTNTYNSRGQPLSSSDPKGELTTVSYDANGYLIAITGPLQTSNDVSRLSYDGFGRIRTFTDVAGYTLTFDYDNLDRITRTTYPDGTFEQFVYNRLDLVAQSDRLGRWATNSYDADQRLIQSTDPLGRTTTFGWCLCGALASRTDAMGRTTTWRYDLQNRPIAKVYPSGATTSLAYENTVSRLKSRRDELGQDMVFEYYADNHLKRVSFPNATVSTPAVSFTYDADYDRMLSMQDGTGTTTHSYNPISTPPALGAGHLASISGPLPNSTVTYQYDPLGRIVSRAINGVAETINYDALGRVSSRTNALGAFAYGYLDATERPAFEAYPTGLTNLYSYYSNLGDQRLRLIQHLKPNGSLLSSFSYAYNAEGHITSWTNQWDSLPTRVWVPGYDAADQMTNSTQTDGAVPVNTYSFGYDVAGNRTLAVTNGIPQHYSYNALNQLIGSDAGAATLATYEWDGLHRLTAINLGTNRSEFTYDGLNRRVRITEKQNGVVVADRRFLWCGDDLCEERDSTGAVVQKRHFIQGTQVAAGASPGNYYYTRDHLGSLREMLDASSAIRARYDYQPFGNRAKLGGDLDSDWGFTSYFFHAPSGLELAPHRVYDAGSGRWMSRDPSGELGSDNLYAYVDNDPLNFVDPLGDCGIEWSKLGAAGKNFALGTGNLFALLYVKTAEAATYGLVGNYLASERGIALAQNYVRKAIANVRGNIAWTRRFIQLLKEAPEDEEAFKMAENMYFTKLGQYAADQAKDEAKKLTLSVANDFYKGVMQELANRGVNHLQQSGNALGQFTGSVGDTLKNVFNPQNNDCNCP